MEGERPVYPPDYIIAGRWTKNSIYQEKMEKELLPVYDLSPEKWQKLKTQYKIYDEYGEI